MNTEHSKYQKPINFFPLSSECQPPINRQVLLHMNDQWLGHDEILVATFDGENYTTNGKHVRPKAAIAGWIVMPCEI